MNSIFEVGLYTSLFISLYFQVFLLVTFLEGRKHLKNEEKTDGLPENLPLVSVFVPCYNEEKTVTKTVESILNLDYPKEKLELFLINDGSTDGTLEKLHSFKNHERITVLSKENGGKHTALNLALNHAKGEIVGCLDADSFVAPNALFAILPYFKNPEVMAVTPAIRIYEPKTLIQKIQNVEYLLSIFIRKALGMMNAIHVTPGPFSFFRREVFEKLGPYRKAHNTEDMELAMRLHKNHFKIANAHKALVFTSGPRNLYTLYRQRLRWTYGFLKNAIDYRELFLRRRYGNLGFFLMPAAVISIFSVIYAVGFSLFRISESIFHQIIRLNTIGFSYTMPKIFSFDFFFVRTDAFIFLSIILIAMTLYFISRGRHLVDEKKMFPTGFLPYFFLYGLIAPIWLSRAVFNVLVGAKTLWR